MAVLFMPTLKIASSSSVLSGALKRTAMLEKNFLEVSQEDQANRAVSLPPVTPPLVSKMVNYPCNVLKMTSAQFPKCSLDLIAK